MTETEWLESADPRPMLRWLRGRASERKLRLFACAVTRLLPPHLDPAEGSERETAVAVAERFAEGQADTRELARAAACSSGEGFWSVAHPDAFEAAEFVVADEQLEGSRGELAALLRDLFGNPLRPVTFDPSWRTPAVLALARASLENRGAGGILDSDRMAVLADALEDAGAADAGILAHCRGSSPHAPGCWVLDVVLGRC
jgi:hypothetical protein